MILLFEGVNGVGKTTYAKMISKLLGWPVYRAFRPKLGHYDEKSDRLKALGVPVNTYIDDMYLADFIRAVEVDLILDRSMPSAIAYDLVEKQGVISDHPAVLNEWFDIVKNVNILFVLLIAPYAVVKGRRTGVSPNKLTTTKLQRQFDVVFRIAPLSKMRINTAEVKLADGVRRILGAVKR